MQDAIEPVHPEYYVLPAAGAAKVARGIVKGTAEKLERWQRTHKKPDPTRFDKAFSELSPSGKQNVKILREWAKNQGYVKLENDDGPEIWGPYEEDGGFSWRLKIKPERSMRDGLGQSSHQPRFDARIREGEYYNPLTGETGGRTVGRHIKLE